MEDESAKDALKVLKIRLVKGEITKKEYQEIRALLQKNHAQQTPSPTRQSIDKKSRLAHVGVEKFLTPKEQILYRTKQTVKLGENSRYDKMGYVTNRRIFFHGKEGLWFKNDTIDRTPLSQITHISLVEKGVITKSVILEINTLKVEGSKDDLYGLYQALQSTQAVGTR